MAVYSKVGSILQKTSTGQQAYTGLGFQPKILIFFGNTSTADGNGTGTSFNFGVATSSTDRRCMSINGSDAATRAITYFKNTVCYATFDNDLFATKLAEADFVSMDADGFTLDWTTADSNARIVNYIAIGGDSVTNVKTGQETARTTAGTKATTGVGFQPDGMLFFAPGSNTAATVEGAQTHQSFIGWASSTSARGFVGQRDIDGAVESSRQQQTNGVIAFTNSADSAAFADLNSLDADGFTLNWTTPAVGAHYFYWVALKGVSIKAGSFNQATSTGNQATTGVGFKPSSLIVQSFCNTSTTSVVSHKRWSFGAGSSSSARGCVWAGSTHAASPAVRKNNLDRTKIIKLMTEASGGPTVDAAADLVTMDADGFTVNWTTVDATARQILYLAIGPYSALPAIKTGVGSLGFKAGGVQEVPKTNAGKGSLGLTGSAPRLSVYGETGTGRLGAKGSGAKGGITHTKQNANSGSIRLAWDASIDPSVTGYRIYWSVGAGPPYPNSVDVGLVLTYLLTGLTPRGNYEFVATAYNASGESGPSNEISEVITYGMAYSARAARQRDYIRQETARLGFAVSGVLAFPQKQGAGSMGLTASGADEITFVEAGSGITDGMVGSGADAVTYVETGTASMEFVGSGEGVLAGTPDPFLKTGAGSMGFTCLGDWEAIWVESGKGMMDGFGGGTGVKISIPTTVGYAKRRKRSEGRSKILSLSEDR